MLTKQALSGCFSSANKARRLWLQPAMAFSSQASEAPFQAFNNNSSSSNHNNNERKNQSTSFPPKSLHNVQQSRSYASGSSGAQPPAPAPAGTDYLSLFQPSYGNALTGYGAYSPGSVLKVYPLPRFVLKEDLMHHIKGGDADTDKAKLVYNAAFRPDYVEFQVDSAAMQKQLMKRLQERGRLGCRFLKAEVSAPMPWTFADRALKDSPRGRTLIMYNVHPSTDHEDVERFFSGYNYDASHIHFVRITNNQDQSRLPLRRPMMTHVAVTFTSKLEALRAMREKAGDFCATSAVNLRLIQ